MVRRQRFNAATIGCLLLCAASGLLIITLKSAGGKVALVGNDVVGIFGKWDEIWWMWHKQEGPHIHLGAAAVVFALICLICVRAKKNAEAREELRGVICLKCGYDLRATPDRCPECGTIPNERVDRST